MIPARFINFKAEWHQVNLSSVCFPYISDTLGYIVWFLGTLLVLRIRLIVVEVWGSHVCDDLTSHVRWQISFLCCLLPWLFAAFIVCSLSEKGQGLHRLHSLVLIKLSTTRQTLLAFLLSSLSLVTWIKSTLLLWHPALARRSGWSQRVHRCG